MKRDTKDAAVKIQSTVQLADLQGPLKSSVLWLALHGQCWICMTTFVTYSQWLFDGNVNGLQNCPYLDLKYPR